MIRPTMPPTARTTILHFLAAHTKIAVGSNHSKHDYSLCGTFKYVNYYASLDTQIANNAVSADVRSIEVCLFCFEVSTLASQYVSHANTHNDEKDTLKQSYTRQMCSRLRENAAEMLGKCERKTKKRTKELEGTPDVRKVETKKRKRQLAGTPDTQRVKTKLDGIDDAITNPSPSHSPGGMSSFSVVEPAAFRERSRHY